MGEVMAKKALAAAKGPTLYKGHKIPANVAERGKIAVRNDIEISDFQTFGQMIDHLTEQATKHGVDVRDISFEKEFGYYDEPDSYVAVYNRPETDDEMYYRLDKYLDALDTEKVRKKQREDYERKEYLRLKKKYEKS